jgi:hypothetical protein
MTTEARRGDGGAGRDAGTMSLAEGLRLAAAAQATQMPPQTVAQAAMAALRQRAAQRLLQPQPGGLPAAAPQRPLWRALAWGSAFTAFAAFAGVAGLTVLLLVMSGAPPAFAPQQAAFEASDFVPLLPPSAWPADTAGRATPAYLVRTELPSERLAALGLPFDPTRAGERRPAELLVHPSGEVLAVRLTR